MPTTSRPDVRSCPECRVTSPSRPVLPRHDVLDRRPRWVLLAVLLAIASVTAALEPLALVLLAMASLCWARRHALRRLDGGGSLLGAARSTAV